MHNYLADPIYIQACEQVSDFIEAQRAKLCETLNMSIELAPNLLQYRVRVDPIYPHVVIIVDWRMTRFLEGNEFYSRLPMQVHAPVIPTDLEAHQTRLLVDMWVMALKNYVKMYNIGTPQVPNPNPLFIEAEKTFVDTMNLLISLDRL